MRNEFERMRASSGYIVQGGEAVHRLGPGRWKEEGSCVVDNRLSLKSGDNAESHLPGLRALAEWLGAWGGGGRLGRAGRESGPDLSSDSSEKLPITHGQNQVCRKAHRQRLEGK